MRDADPVISMMMRDIHELEIDIAADIHRTDVGRKAMSFTRPSMISDT